MWTPGVVCATGSPADFDGLGVIFLVLPRSRALHRFIIGTDRSPNWFRLLWFENRRFSSSRESKILERSHCLGRAGRHRRTSGNHSTPRLDPSHIRWLSATSTRGLKSLAGNRTVDCENLCRIHPALTRPPVSSAHQKSVISGDA